MKSITKFITLIAFTFAALSFTTVDKEKKEISETNSNITWKGYKVTGSHAGTIKIKSGHLDFDKGRLTGGAFTVDMTSINVTDLSGGSKTQLEGHLKSDDFFGVANHPTAQLTLTKVKASGENSYEATGDITIKGKTEVITFTIAVFKDKANASLKIDRTKFGVKYGSSSFFDGLKDKAINDEFDLVAELKFK